MLVFWGKRSTPIGWGSKRPCYSISADKRFKSVSVICPSHPDTIPSTALAATSSDKNYFMFKFKTKLMNPMVQWGWACLLLPLDDVTASGLVIVIVYVSDRHGAG